MNDKHIQAMKLIQEGKRLVDISKEVGLSINIIKNLSRLNKMEQELREIGLNEVYIDLFKKMDFKALELSPMVKTKDLELISEVIASTWNISKKDIKNIVKKIQEDKQKVDELKSNIISKKENQDNIQDKFKKAQEELNKNSNPLEYKLFSNLTSARFEFYRTHVKKKDDKYVLVKKLVKDFQRELKDDGILEQRGTICYIVDLESFVSICNEKIANKEELRWKDWSAFDRYGRYFDGYRTTYYRDDDTYKINEKLDELDIFTNISKVKKLKKELTEARKKVKNIKSQEVNSYKENTQVVNAIAVNEIEGHRLIQDVVCKYYYAKGNVAVPEVSQDEYRFDCFTYDFFKNIEIIEVKNSRSDFIGDKKYINYKKYCNKLYFALNSEIILRESEIENLKNEGIGLYIVDLSKNDIKLVLEAKEMRLNDIIKEELINKANKILIEKTKNGY